MCEQGSTLVTEKIGGIHIRCRDFLIARPFGGNCTGLVQSGQYYAMLRATLGRFNHTSDIIA